MPNASAIGRVLARIDGDALDDALDTWRAHHAAHSVGQNEALAGLAVDDKAMRGSGNDDRTAVHLPAAALHGSQTAIAQRQAAANGIEIPAMAPLLARSLAGARRGLAAGQIQNRGEQSSAPSLASTGQTLIAVLAAAGTGASRCWPPEASRNRR